MATQTTNYSLTKDADTDYYNIEIVNTNLDSIDTALKTISDKADQAKESTVSATKLATARKINGVNFDGTADITIADSTKEPAIAKNTAFNKNYETNAGNIKMDGTASVGVSDSIARGDHVHPADSTKAPVVHTHDKIINQDTRGTNGLPLSYGAGLSVHLKNNTTDGLADGGMYHGVIDIAQYQDLSGGAVHQIALTDTGNLWMRTSVGSAWGSWTKIWSSMNHGAGSGLNADLLDGLHATSFVGLAAGLAGQLSGVFTGNLNDIVSTCCVYASSVTNSPTGNNGFCFTQCLSSSYEVQIFVGVNSNEMYIRYKGDGVWGAWNKFWSNGNMGPGSGLNADRVDNLHVTGSSTPGLRSITTSTADPSGGSDGDIWIKYNP